ncbi:hypothetical protein EJ06DRAFT_509070 [Trichodelitschia bisporula]|uniref:PNPLA domain-containing protein n=1 Tax=Trichodelitschia bisporula TaxID=703511 RepID=A0A6G1HZG5_9PEZI|nr:hypothetical protein EJ06DRAFT_509070 [Trichodelitschia bisporula]
MGARSGMFAFLRALAGIAFEVVFFWQLRLYHYIMTPSPQDELRTRMAEATSFEEWEAAAFELDELLGYDLWCQTPSSRHYDYRLINTRLTTLLSLLEPPLHIPSLIALIRSGLVRNLANITHPALYTHAHAGTKLLIEDYITHTALAIEALAAYPPDELLPPQAKLDVLHDARQALGRSALVFAPADPPFALCHLGVVRALYFRGLLPRILCGNGIGALVGALVGSLSDDELVPFLDGLSASLAALADEDGSGPESWARMLHRHARGARVLDASVLEALVRQRVRLLSFEDAYARTKRVVNITVGGCLLNYLTAPNVLLASAALASLDPESALVTKPGTPAYTPTVPALAAPLTRLASLFNATHFMLSHPPTLLPSPAHPRSRFPTLAGLLAAEVGHRIEQADTLGLIPTSLRGALLPEHVPGAVVGLVSRPGALASWMGCGLGEGSGDVDCWVREGERAVWPSVPALRVRCAVEVELERGYQAVRRWKVAGEGEGGKGLGSGGGRRRGRALSFGGAEEGGGYRG